MSHYIELLTTFGIPVAVALISSVISAGAVYFGRRGSLIRITLRGAEKEISILGATDDEVKEIEIVLNGAAAASDRKDKISIRADRLRDMGIRQANPGDAPEKFEAGGPKTDPFEYRRPDKPDGAKAVQAVMFATNRLLRRDLPFGFGAITDDWSRSLTYGRAWVSIPGRHRLGKIERPKIVWWKLRREEENPAKHFMISEIDELSDKDFFAGMRSSANSVLVFVHGYNVSFTDSIFRTAQIAYDINFPGVAVAFSWPSAASPELYDRDLSNAHTSALGFLELLTRIKNDSNIDNVCIVAHSLGSHIVVEALQAARLDLGISELIFAAPDVARNHFASRADLVKRAAGGVTLYASSADIALKISKLKAGGLSRAGDMPEEGPLLIDGVDLIDVTAIGEDMFALNHRVFSGQRSALDDLGRIVMTRTRPPHIRTTTLEGMPDRNSPKYWRHPY